MLFAIKNAEEFNNITTFKYYAMEKQKVLISDYTIFYLEPFYLFLFLLVVLNTNCCIISMYVKAEAIS